MPEREPREVYLYTSTSTSSDGVMTVTCDYYTYDNDDLKLIHPEIREFFKEIGLEDDPWA
jgi:hypothetical protein